MYINTDTIIKAAGVVSAAGVIIALLVGVYKRIDKDKRQSVVINAMQEELTILCYAVKGTLEGLIEQGCDGPCKDALDRLNKHLNKSAHKTDL